MMKFIIALVFLLTVPLVSCAQEDPVLEETAIVIAIVYAPPQSGMTTSGALLSLNEAHAVVFRCSRHGVFALTKKSLWEESMVRAVAYFSLTRTGRHVFRAWK